MFIACKTKDIAEPPNPNQNCVFPFKWDNMEYTKCTDVDYDGFWCGTQFNVTSEKGWGICGETCPKETIGTPFYHMCCCLLLRRDSIIIISINVRNVTVWKVFLCYS